MYKSVQQFYFKVQAYILEKHLCICTKIFSTALLEIVKNENLPTSQGIDKLTVDYYYFTVKMKPFHESVCINMNRFGKQSI